MNPIPSFDPVANPTGIIHTNGINKGEQLLLFNSSLSCLQLTFNDKTQDILPPSWARDWTKNGPMGDITYTTLFTLSLTGQPVSLLYGTLYEPDEHVSSVNQALQYVYAIGNTINTSSVSGQTLTNIGAAPSSNLIIEIANNASGGDTFSLDNQGNMILGDTAYNGSCYIVGPTIVANTTKFMAGGGNETHMINTAGSDIVFYSPATTQLMRLTNGGILEIATIQPVSSNIILATDNSHATLVQNAGSTIMGVQGNGIFCYQPLEFPTASSSAHLTACCFIPTIALATTINTFNHNLGITPDLILLMPSGTSSTARTYQTTNYTSTTFQATGNSAYSCIGMAIKF